MKERSAAGKTEDKSLEDEGPCAVVYLFSQVAASHGFEP